MADPAHEHLHRHGTMPETASEKPDGAEHVLQKDGQRFVEVVGCRDVGCSPPPPLAMFVVVVVVVAVVVIVKVKTIVKVEVVDLVVKSRT